MPRNVRNFWIELEVDGKKEPVASGPRSKDGGFRLDILQRSKGTITRALSVSGRVDSTGRLVLNAYTVDNQVVNVYTDR
jgi:hypothetical protein